ncbi:hypothetical protein MED297_08371 [Reinekea sp. MED297]|uniref:Uncharacterized protein n=2 Tax=Reinekea TaxID=230494 RepID=A4BD07_9GAMM|nr:hypothetical protein MED297_08371 [Reinekea sp. MED297] [Reinekea blandensis MED297]
MAETLFKAAQARGVQSSWYLEESTDHPVHPVELKKSKYSTDFPERCLRKWSSFIADNKDKEHLFILEGSLFQSTVRFMLEGKNEELVADYYKACQSILSAVHPKLIYLRPVDAKAHIEWVMAYRGEEWTTKVAEYLEKTPYCADKHWQGENGLLSFWCKYALLCDSLAVQTSIPYHTVNAGFGYFERQFDEAMSHIRSEKGVDNQVLGAC